MKQMFMTDLAFYYKQKFWKKAFEKITQPIPVTKNIDSAAQIVRVEKS